MNDVSELKLINWVWIDFAKYSTKLYFGAWTDSSDTQTVNKIPRVNSSTILSLSKPKTWLLIVMENWTLD